MGGQEAYLLSKDKYHKIKSLMMSGYSELETTRQMGSVDSKYFMPKPFDHSLLITRVAELLKD